MGDGVSLPVRHASIQAIVTNSDTYTKKLVTYWIIFSLISLFEHAFMVILQWLPFWPYMKLMIVCWTMIPRFDGAFYVYNHVVHPCLYLDFPTIISWFKKLQEFYVNHFLVETAYEHVEAKRQPEALEKPNSNEIRAAEPVSVQTVNDTVILPEINGGSEPDPPLIPSVKQVQKEWRCAMCQVKVPCEKTLKSHLQGRKHRETSKRLTEAKNQPYKDKVGSVSAVKEPLEGGSISHVQARQKTDVASNWARYFAAYRTVNAIDIAWQRPPQGWCCLNTNGTVAPATGMGIAGGVIRDSAGRWLLGFCKSVGVTNVLQAELWGLYEGLQIASAYNFQYLVIQIDNVQVAQLVEDKEAGRSPLSLVRAIFIFRQRCSMTKIQWIRHEGNMVADGNG
ncbi:hypothetical protein GQ457_04G003470 [Hibiscus cannabinus]